MKQDNFKVNCRGKVLNLRNHTHVMGILNVTPDSFSDGGKYFSVESAVERGLELEREGADILDVGAESTRPGSDPVLEKEELRRLLPIVDALLEKVSIPVSVDTYKSKIADQMLRRGVHIINDISGLRFDPEMKNVIAKHNAAVVIMHIKGKPRDMQVNPHYTRIVPEIKKYLADSVSMALEAGIARESIVIDPGLGFGKRLGDNYTILRRLDSFQSLGCPLLIGPSRKMFIRKELNLSPSESFEGTAAVVAAGIQKGVHIVRVHDVQQTVKVCRIADLIIGKRNIEHGS